MFAEYAAIDYHNAIILPENLDIETSAPYFCVGVTGKIRHRGHELATLTLTHQPFTVSTLANSNQASG